WNAPQTVTVTGVDDSVKDGNVMYAITVGPATSADPRYAGLDPADVTVTNIDDENPGLMVNAAASLTTNENGPQATFTVSLTAQPKATVTVPVVSTNTTEGTVSPAQLVFTPDDWNAAKVVTVTGVNDDEAEGPQSYMIQLGPTQSSDGDFDHLGAQDVP